MTYGMRPKSPNGLRGHSDTKCDTAREQKKSKNKTNKGVIIHAKMKANEEVYKKTRGLRVNGDEDDSESLGKGAKEDAARYKVQYRRDRGHSAFLIRHYWIIL